MTVGSAVFKEFRNTAQIVILDRDKDPERLSKLAADVRGMRPSGSQSLPNVYIASSDATRGIRYLTTAEMRSDLDGIARELKKSIKEDPNFLKGIDYDPEAEAAREAAMKEVREWTNIDGQKIEASIEKLGDEEVTFKMQDGSSVPYPLEKLSEDSRAKLKELAGDEQE